MYLLPNTVGIDARNFGNLISGVPEILCNLHPLLSECQEKVAQVLGWHSTCRETWQSWGWSYTGKEFTAHKRNLVYIEQMARGNGNSTIGLGPVLLPDMDLRVVRAILHLPSEHYSKTPHSLGPQRCLVCLPTPSVTTIVSTSSVMSHADLLLSQVWHSSHRSVEGVYINKTELLRTAFKNESLVSQ